MCDHAQHLGHIVDGEGLHVTPGKIEAIVKAPKPQNVTELRDFSGLVNYYDKFIPNLASTLQPFNNLLQKICKWLWSEECTKAVQEANEKLISSHILTHYNPSLPIRLANDASQYGIGAVLSYVTRDVVEKPITLPPRPSQSQKETILKLRKKGCH